MQGHSQKLHAFWRRWQLKLRAIRPSQRLQAAGRAATSLVVIVMITALLLASVEGIASVIVVSRGQGAVLLERSHTEYDPELGWINQPSVRIDNLYGPGLFLETNSQRFRNSRDFEQGIPTGKVRAVCTGDSFTLGYGVKNDDAWCQLLVLKDPRFETVNMGQGGYGIDQAYLWYRRDGSALQHDVLIFAFIAADFNRMLAASFIGYPKPVLTVQDDKPVVLQQSSRWGFYARGVAQRMSGLRDLRVLELLRPPAEPAPYVDPPVMSEAEGRRLLLAIFADLESRLRERGTSLLVVLLPTANDYRVSSADGLARFLRSELSRRKIPFLDLVSALRSESPALVPALFQDHYSELGNRWIADRLHQALSELSHVKTRLQQLGSNGQTISRLVPVGASLILEPIPLNGATLRTSKMSVLAALALDGLPSTRWHSGAVQQGDETLVLDLGAPRRFRQLRLHLGDVSYDYGRVLAVDVADDEASFVEVLRARGENVLTPSLGEGGAAQLLTLPESVERRYVRVRQLATSHENFWSVAEVGLMSDAHEPPALQLGQ